jgi:hypothetical protein
MRNRNSLFVPVELKSPGIKQASDLTKKATILTFASLAVMTALTVSTPTMADANVKDVTAACDRTPGCSYSVNKKTGNIEGCSTQSGVCFQCGQDRKCTGTDPKRVGTGKGKPMNIGGVNLSPDKAPPKGKTGTKVTGKNVNSTTGSGITDPQTKGPTQGRRHEGGGARH